MRSRRRRVAPLVLAGALACVARNNEATSAGADTESGSDMWPPAACDVDESPFLSAECLDELRNACSLRDEQSCVDAEEIAFDGGGYTVRCTWASYVAFANTDSCSVAQRAERCEASVDTECFDACTAIGENVIIAMCGGPLGPWSAVDSEPGEYPSTCAPDVPPGTPPICECAPVACDVD